jgi:hypothetical protein
VIGHSRGGPVIVPDWTPRRSARLALLAVAVGVPAGLVMGKRWVR